MGQKVLFVTGIHGSYRHLRELLMTAETQKIDRLIIGGDLFPKEAAGTPDSVDNQKDNLESVFIPLFNDLLQRTKLLLVIHPGNNDLRYPTLALLKKWSRIKKGRVILAEDGLFNKLLDLPLLAYPYIPPTPCPVKDWEKWDDDKSGMSIPESFFRGFQSEESKGMMPVLLSPSHAGDTIRGDLEARALGLENLDFVFLAQSPPINTPLDLIHDGEHIGSSAIRDFIAKTQPILSLHGHAHESPKHSGEFQCTIGKTLCINPGQSTEESDDPCQWVTFDLEDPKASLQHNTIS